MTAPRRSWRLTWPASVYWLIAGSLVGYAVFVERVFLSTNGTMVFDEYVPRLKNVGNDLRLTLHFAQMLFSSSSPYLVDPPVPYPPLGLGLFRVLVKAGFAAAYRTVIVGSVLSFLLLMLFCARQRNAGVTLSASRVYLIALGLLSYPFQFEIERGQWNIIAAALALGGVRWFHSARSRAAEYTAMALFLTAVQLKIYPIIFVVGFWRASSSVARNLIRLGGLGVWSIALLWGLGHRYATEFFSVIAGFSSRPYVWFGNHSITAFSEVASSRSAGLVGWTLVLIGGAWMAYLLFRRCVNGDDPRVLFAALMLALLVPSTSHDYTLSLLPVGLALLFEFVESNTLSALTWKRTAMALLLFVNSAAYHVALTPYTARTQWGPWSMSVTIELMLILGIGMLAMELASSARRESPNGVTT